MVCAEVELRCAILICQWFQNLFPDPTGGCPDAPSCRWRQRPAGHLTLQGFILLGIKQVRDHPRVRQYCAGAYRVETTGCCFEALHVQNGRFLLLDRLDFQPGSRSNSVKGLPSDGDVLGENPVAKHSSEPTSSLDMCTKCSAVNARHVLSSVSHAWPRHRNPSGSIAIPSA